MMKNQMKDRLKKEKKKFSCRECLKALDAKLSQYTIHPLKNSWYFFWDYFENVFVIYSILSAPFIIATHFQVLETFLTMEIVSDVVLLIDSISEFFKQYDREGEKVDEEAEKDKD